MNNNIKERLEILHDAFQTTLRNDVIIARGSYLSAREDPLRGNSLTCRVCLLGSLLVAKVVGSSGALNLDLNQGSVTDALEKVFDVETLALAEAMFEGFRTIGAYDECYWSKHPPDQKLKLLMNTVSRRWPLSADRARALLNHLIEHEGKVDLEDLDEHYALLDECDLSRAAKAVLRNHGITPYTENEHG